jgi:hypothetical protein
MREKRSPEKLNEMHRPGHVGFVFVLGWVFCLFFPFHAAGIISAYLILVSRF